MEGKGEGKNSDQVKVSFLPILPLNIQNIHLWCHLNQGTRLSLQQKAAQFVFLQTFIIRMFQSGLWVFCLSFFITSICTSDFKGVILCLLRLLAFNKCLGFK